QSLDIARFGFQEPDVCLLNRRPRFQTELLSFVDELALGLGKTLLHVSTNFVLLLDRSRVGSRKLVPKGNALPRDRLPGRVSSLFSTVSLLDSLTRFLFNGFCTRIPSLVLCR